MTQTETTQPQSDTPTDEAPSELPASEGTAGEQPPETNGDACSTMQPPATSADEATTPAPDPSAAPAEASAPVEPPAELTDASPSTSDQAQQPSADGAQRGQAQPGARREGGGQQAQVEGRQPAGQQRREPRQREPLPWPELRAAAAVASPGLDVEELKELFRMLPDNVRNETIEGVREFRKGARRPVSAHAGKSLARAVHTARRGRRRPDTDREVSDALAQALAAEIVASLDVEIAARVILPKRDLLEREARNARRRARDEDDRRRDEWRRQRRAQNAGAGGQTTFGTFSGAKIRGLDQVQKALEQQQQQREQS